MIASSPTSPRQRGMPAAKPFDIEMLYDGACPLCLREARLLQRLDQHRKIRFTNIAAADFDATTVGKSRQELMLEMHGRLPDGRWVTGVEAFRHFYTAVGFGSIVRLSRIPGVSQLLDVGYRFFARHRLWLTGRCEDCTPVCSSPSSAGSDTRPK